MFVILLQGGMASLLPLKTSRIWRQKVKAKFPRSIYGFQDVLLVLSRTPTFNWTTGRLWVHPDTKLCRSALGLYINYCLQPQVVKAYDSMRTGDVPTSTKESIATLLNTSARTVYLVYPDVQQQTNRSSCRLFALAFAHTLCEGQDPSRITYCQDSLRSHF